MFGSRITVSNDSCVSEMSCKKCGSQTLLQQHSDTLFYLCVHAIMKAPPHRKFEKHITYSVLSSSHHLQSCSLQFKLGIVNHNPNTLNKMFQKQMSHRFSIARHSEKCDGILFQHSVCFPANHSRPVHLGFMYYQSISILVSASVCRFVVMILRGSYHLMYL